MKIFKLSPSSLALMKSCPRCFWLTLHKVWKRPANGFPTLPLGVDRVLKAYFDRFIGKDVLPSELKSGYKLFEDKKLLEKWRNCFSGIECRDEWGNVLHGALDNILVKRKKLIVLEYKTRGFPIKNVDVYQIQLDVYNYLLRKNGYDTEDYAYLLYYIPKKAMPRGKMVFDTIMVRREVDVRRVGRLWKEALDLLNGECPSESCEWCKDFSVK